MPHEVLGFAEPAGEADGLRVASDRGTVDLRSARVGQAEQPRDLVEGLARRVVDGLAEQLDIRHQVAHKQQRSVPAGDQQGDGGVVDGAAVGEHVGTDVPDQVVDGVERLVERDGERLGRADADHERAGEAWTARDGDRVELLQGHTGLGERLFQRRRERLEVCARCDLRDDTAVAGVLLHG